MPGYSVTAANQALDALGGALPGTPVNTLAFTQLHIGDPGTTGANESTATAQATTWNNASARAKTNSSALTWTGQAAGTPVTHFMTRNQAATAGATYGISGALTSAVSAATITAAAGSLSLSA